MQKQKNAQKNEFLEQATPSMVADYRAGRLACPVAADLCCGVGNDAVALAKKCGKVFAFDTNEAALKIARENAQKEKVTNIEFLKSDAFDLDLAKIKPDVVFADPSRRVDGTRVKALDMTRPNTLELIEFMKKSGVKGFCIEVSHALDLKELPEGCEKEFVSLGHEPNCISLYFGSLKKCGYSAVLLPAAQRLEADKAGEKIGHGKMALRYLFELDEGIVKMQMQKALHESLGRVSERVFPFNESFFGSTQKVFSPFFKNSFKVLAELENRGEISGKLKKLKAGKVVLRGRFSMDEQLALKAELETGLEGKLKLHVFFLNGSIFVCKNLAF